MLAALKNNQRGAASLEFMVAFVPWFIIVLLFLNLLFLLGSLMNNQATTVRAAQQIAAAGCLPTGLTSQITDGGLGLIGARNPQIVVRSFSTWSGSGAEFTNGALTTGDPVPSCNSLAANSDAVTQGRFIYIQLQYEQILPLLDAATGVSDGSSRITVRRGALVVSQSLENR